MRDFNLKMRKMLNIQRLSGTQKLRSYNLAEHSYFVTIYFKKFCELQGVNLEVSDLDTVMFHDSVELITCDLPYHIKNLNERTKSLWEELEEEAVKAADPMFSEYTDTKIKNKLGTVKFKLFKIADLFELLLFIEEELKLGNNTKPIKKVQEKCYTIIESLLKEEKFFDVQEYIQSATNMGDLFYG